MNEDTIVWFSASGRTIFLVSEEVNPDIRRESPPAMAINQSINQKL